MANYDIHSMICPKCGFEQPETPECANCGIIIEKWEAQKTQDEAGTGGVWGESGDHRARAVAQQQAAAAAGAWGQQVQVSRSSKSTDEGSDDEAISGKGVVATRVVLGLAAAGAAGWLATAVNPLDNYTVMAIVAVAAALLVWVGFSVKSAVTARQLVFEGLLAIVCIAGVVVTVPGLFDDAGAKASQPVAKTGSSTSKKAKKPVPTASANDSALGRFTTASLEYLEAVGLLLTMEGPASHAQWDGLTPQLDFTALTSKFQALSPADRGEALVAWEKTQKVGRDVSGLLQRYKQPTNDGSGFVFAAPADRLSSAQSAQEKAVEGMEQLLRDLKVIR